MTTLFNLDAVTSRRKRPRGPWTQVERCKRCNGSTGDVDSAYCHRLDLCLEFRGGCVYTLKDMQIITCDGLDWQYGTDSDQAAKEGR